MWARAPHSTRSRSVSGQQAGRHLGVLTVDGAFSYYTDWEWPDPGLAKSGDNNGVNMWGPYDGPGWPAHDPVVNADKLPRIPMYITTATGIPGPYDTLADPRIGNDVTDFVVQLVLGGGIEAATHHCTTQLADKTNALGMNNIRYNFKPAGTHSWGYWEDDLHDSWPMIAASLGV